ncbi:MAG: hypothetical protein HY996_04805 [Micrococcales bacterium]|nr:hypothetical protein [Micrococcales bacterium]
MVVSDIVCKAVLRYARALARAGETEVVEVPTRDVTGLAEIAYLLVGPTSDIFSTPIVGVDDVPDGRERYAASQMERRTVRIHPTRPEWPGEMHDVPDLEVDY